MMRMIGDAGHKKSLKPVRYRSVMRHDGGGRKQQPESLRHLDILLANRMPRARYVRPLAEYPQIYETTYRAIKRWIRIGTDLG